MFGFPHIATCNYTALKIHTFIGPMLLECKIRKTNCILMYYSSVKFAHRTPKKLAYFTVTMDTQSLLKAANN